MAGKPEARQFAISEGPAVRERSPILIGLMGPSGGGKTFSALRLAKGIQSVVGGDIGVVDTEGRRALHYADRFKFRHLDFKAPFASLDYLAAIRQMVAAGCRTVIVDSMSHEHEGPGGLLDFWEAEIDRMAGDDWAKRERVKMLAIQKPKAARRALINGILNIEHVNLIFCFRAKESAKPVKGPGGKTEVVSQGFMPIAGDEFVFEMTLNALLLPNAGGVPTWESEERGERMMIKLPIQFREALLKSKAPLDEELGARLAKWAEGGSPKPPAQDQKALEDQSRQETAKGDGPDTPREEPSSPGGAESGQGGDPKPKASTTATRGQKPSEFLIVKAEEAGKLAAEEGAEREAPADLSPEEAEAWLKAFDAEAERLDAAAGAEEEGAGDDKPVEILPAADDKPANPAPPVEEARDEPAPENAFATFANALADSTGWPDIYSALRVLTTSADFKAAERERQGRARIIAYRRIEELNAKGLKFDVLTDPHAFRCYVEAEENDEALVGMFTAFKRQAAWVGLTAEAQAAFEGAVRTRISTIQSIKTAAGEFA